MRHLTILLAVAFGMMLSWIMLLNPQIVQVRLDSNGLGWIQPAVRQMPLWQGIFWSVFIGMAIGFLLTWSGGAERRRRIMRDIEDERDAIDATDDEPDYVVGLTSRRR